MELGWVLNAIDNLKLKVSDGTVGWVLNAIDNLKLKVSDRTVGWVLNAIDNLKLKVSDGTVSWVLNATQGEIHIRLLLFISDSATELVSHWKLRAICKVLHIGIS